MNQVKMANIAIATKIILSVNEIGEQHFEFPTLNTHKKKRTKRFILFEKL